MLKKDFTIAGIIMLVMGIVLYMIIRFFDGAFFAVFGGRLFPNYYPKQEVKQYISEFVPGSTYITRKKQEETRSQYYLYQDAYGREFVIESSSVEMLILYHPKLFRGYECCIFQSNINEIKDILKDAGFKYRIEGDAPNIGNDNILKWASTTPSLSPMDISLYYAKEEDITQIADAMTKIDGLLKYNYNKDLDSKLNFDDYDGGNVNIYFKTLTIKSEASFKFSTSESERWTTETLYETIREQFQKNVTKRELDEEWEKNKKQEIALNQQREETERKKTQKQLEQQIQRDIFQYLKKKYDETFITDTFSYFTISDTNDEVFFRLSCERLPEVKIEVTGKRNEDGSYSYTDNFDEGRKN